MNADETTLDEADDEIEEYYEDDFIVPKGFDLHIDVQIKYVDQQRGIEVPLGYDNNGEWEPIKIEEALPEECVTFGPRRLLRWLTSSGHLPWPLLDEGEAAEAVKQTLQQCTTISKTP